MYCGDVGGGGGGGGEESKQTLLTQWYEEKLDEILPLWCFGREVFNIGTQDRVNVFCWGGGGGGKGETINRQHSPSGMRRNLMKVCQPGMFAEKLSM